MCLKVSSLKSWVFLLTTNILTLTFLRRIFFSTQSTFQLKLTTFCNSVVVVCCCVKYLFFVYFFCTWIRVLDFLFELFYICHFGAFYSWLCGMGFVHCWKSYSDLKLLISVSFGLLWRVVSLAIIPQLLFYILLNLQSISKQILNLLIPFHSVTPSLNMI